MSSSPELRSPAKINGDTRKILGPGGNRVRDLEEQKRKKEGVKKPGRPKKSTVSQTVVRVRGNGSVDSSSSESSTIKAMNSKRGVERTDVKKPAKIVPEGVEAAELLSPLVPVPLKRCDWITPNSGKFLPFNLISAITFLFVYVIMCV